jgi:hypothetical protein
MNPVGRRFKTSGFRWSHSEDLSPQYAHRTLAGSISRIFKAFAISLGVGGIAGTMAFTKALVILEIRDVGVCTFGIRKAC